MMIVNSPKYLLHLKQLLLSVSSTTEVVLTVVTLCLLMIGSTDLVLSSQPGATKTCLTDNCEGVLFEGELKESLPSKHEDFLHGEKGERVQILAIDFSDRHDLWEGKIGDRRGFFFKSMIKQNNYHPFLKHVVSNNVELHQILRDTSITLQMKKYVGPISGQTALSRHLTIEEEKIKLNGFVDGEPEEPSMAAQSHQLQKESSMDNNDGLFENVYGDDDNEDVEGDDGNEIDEGVEDDEFEYDYVDEYEDDTRLESTATTTMDHHHQEIPPQTRNPTSSTTALPFTEKDEEDDDGHLIPVTDEFDDDGNMIMDEIDSDSVEIVDGGVLVTVNKTQEQEPRQDNQHEPVPSQTPVGGASTTAESYAEQLTASQIGLDPQQGGNFETVKKEPALIDDELAVKRQKAAEDHARIKAEAEKEAAEAVKEAEHLIKQEQTELPKIVLPADEVITTPTTAVPPIPDPVQQIPPVPAPKRRISLGSALNHAHSHGPGGHSHGGEGHGHAHEAGGHGHSHGGERHGHAHEAGGHGHSHGGEPTSQGMVNPPLNDQEQQIPPPTTQIPQQAASSDSNIPDNTETTTPLPSTSGDPIGDSLDDMLSAVTPPPPASGGQDGSIPTTPPSVAREEDKAPNAKTQSSEPTAQSGVGSVEEGSCDKEGSCENVESADHREKREEPAVPPVTGTATIQSFGGDSGTTELPPHLRDIPPHLMKEAGLLPPDEETAPVDTGPGIGTKIANMIRAVLTGIRNIIPGASTSGIDELGILVAIVFTLSFFIHLVGKLLDSSHGQKQRIDLSRYVGMDRQMKALRMENEQLREGKGVNNDAQEHLMEMKREVEKKQNDLKHAQQDYSQLKKNNEEMEKSLRQIRNEMKSLESKQNEYKENNTKLNRELESLKTENAEYESKIQACMLETETARDQSEKSQRSEGKIRKEMDHKTKEINELKVGQLIGLHTHDNLESLKSNLKEKEVALHAASDRKNEVEGELHGLKLIVDELNIKKGSDDSNGWSDLGDDVDGGGNNDDERRQKLAELMDSSRLHGRLKQAKAEIARHKQAAQKEADARVRAESKLSAAASEVQGRSDKLDKAEQERSDLLKQVTQLTALITSKESEGEKVRTEMVRTVEDLTRRNKELQEDLQLQKDKKLNWEDKYSAKEEDYRQLRKEIDRKEMKYYNELKERDAKLRRLEMQNMQIRQHMAVNSGGLDTSVGEIMGGGAGSSPPNPASNNSSEAEMRDYLNTSGDGGGMMRGISPPVSAHNSFMYSKGGSSGGGGGWGSMPSAAMSSTATGAGGGGGSSSMHSHWSMLDSQRGGGGVPSSSSAHQQYKSQLSRHRHQHSFDSPPSSDWGSASQQRDSLHRRSKRDKSRGRKSEHGDVDEDLRANRRRSRSRGARSDAAAPMDDDYGFAGNSSFQKGLSRRRSMRNGAPSPLYGVEGGNGSGAVPSIVDNDGFDPVYGGPSDTDSLRRQQSSGGKQRTADYNSGNVPSGGVPFSGDKLANPNSSTSQNKVDSSKNRKTKKPKKW